MTSVNSRVASALFVLGVVALSVTVAPQVSAQTAAVDPVATQTLQRMTDNLGSLKQFSEEDIKKLDESQATAVDGSPIHHMQSGPH
jgi:predicted PurR-regulated permease PerM